MGLALWGRTQRFPAAPLLSASSPARPFNHPPAAFGYAPCAAGYIGSN